MKKIVVFRMLTILLGLLMLSCLTGCSKESSEPYQYEKIEVNLSLKESENSTCCYANETQMVFSIGEKTGAQVGPLVDTKRLILYDFKAGQAKKQFHVNDTAYIYNAVPYKNGLIYSTYKNVKNGCIWYVKYVSPDENVTLDKGLCSGYDRIPTFTCIEDTPVYAFEDITSAYCYGVKKIESDKVIEINRNSNGKLINTQLYSNGREYCFLSIEEKLMCNVGTLSEIKFTKKVGNNPISFGVNEKQAVCAVSDENDILKLVSVDLESGALTESELEHPLYRITGSGESIVCTDNDFNPIILTNGNGVDMVKCPLNKDEFSETEPVFYFGVGKNVYITEFRLTEGSIDYYKLSIK